MAYMLYIEMQQYGCTHKHNSFERNLEVELLTTIISFILKNALQDEGRTHCADASPKI